MKPMDRVIEKARRLLRLRDRAATAGEAQAAAHALARMLEKHRITVAELEMRGAGGAEAMVADKSRPLVRYQRLSHWRARLVEVLCEHYGIAFWRRSHVSGTDSKGRIRSNHAIHLCGRPSDVATVRHMFAWLSGEAERLGRKECDGKGTIAHNNWRTGFVEGLDEQLKQARGSIAFGHDEAAIILRERQSEAFDFLRIELDHLGYKTLYRRFAHDEEAHAAGKRRGRAQHLGDSLDDEQKSNLALPEAT